MRSNNRFDKPVMYNAQIKYATPKPYLPDFAAMGQRIGQMQKQRDMTEVNANNMFPNAREVDKDKAQEFSQMYQGKFKDIATTYKEKGIAAGNKAMKDLTHEMHNQKKDPNSYYNKFKQLKDKQASDLKHIQDLKDPVGDNKAYAHNIYQKEAAKGIEDFWDYGNKISKGTLASPDTYSHDYIDIQKDLTSHLKNLKPEQVYQALGSKFGKMWFREGHLKYLSKQEIAEVTQKVLGDRKYSNQLKVERWATEQNLDPSNIRTQLDDGIKDARKLYGDAVQNATAAQAKAAGLTLPEYKSQLQNELSNLENEYNKSSALDDQTLLSQTAAQQVVNNYTDTTASIFRRRDEQYAHKFRQDIAAAQRNKLKKEEIAIMYKQYKATQGGLSTQAAGMSSIDWKNLETSSRSTMRTSEMGF